MAVEYKDYYKILGVNKDAGEKENAGIRRECLPAFNQEHDKPIIVAGFSDSTGSLESSIGFSFFHHLLTVSV